VAGVGLAAIRDSASAFLSRSDLPIRGRWAYIWGRSQSGRFLRQFLHDGFNADEQERRVFDAVWPHVGGAALGSFNERFAMPGYDRFPVTRFPFTDEPQQDRDGTRDGIQSIYRPEQRPKVFYTNTPVEYWGGGRAAALTHVTIDGTRDLTPPDNVRIYLLSGSQHNEAAFPPPRTTGQQLSNPTPQRSALRAILTNLDRWVREDVRPPDSRYPKLSDGTLVPVDRVQFPALPGVRDPRSITAPGRMTARGFDPLPFLVPQVDGDGNDVAGIRMPDVAIPLATTTGWNFRAETVGNPDDIVTNLGSYIPFVAGRAQRDARGDPRRAIDERYGDRDDYLQRIRRAAAELVGGRYLLEEDLSDILERANAHWDYATRSRRTSD
jgi:hypothetical protein